jgi:hypothetical protein
MRRLLRTLFLASLPLLISCGGGQSTSANNSRHVTALQVRPATVSIAAGYAQNVHAQATFSDGSSQDVSTSAMWTSSEPAVASVTLAGGQVVVKGIKAGSSSLAASFESASAQATLSVSRAVLTAIDVMPGSASVALGLQQQLKAVGRFSDNSTADVTASAMWHSDKPNVAALAASGMFTATGLGSCMVSATADGVSGAATITVGPAQLVSIAVSPASATVSAGRTQQFAATGRWTDGSSQDMSTAVTWNSSTPSVAIVDNAGMAQTVIAGTSTVSASSGGISGAGLLTATQSAAATGIHIGLRSHINPTPGLDNYSDVVADGNYAYVASWHNTSGVQIYDISNPDAPVFVTTYLPSVGAQNMQGIQVRNGIGYFASDSTGTIDIVDLSNPASPALIFRISVSGQSNVHDITLDQSAQHLFVPGYPNNSNVQIWNVSNPSAPVLLTTIHGSDPVAVHDVTVFNNRLFMAGWGSTATGESSDIWDVSNVDTQAPVLLGSFTSGIHTQDVSFSRDGKYLFCPHELAANGDVAVFDISDPTNVQAVTDIAETQLGLFSTSPSTSKIMGNYLFVAWYQAGLALFDISDPKNPVLVGNYDTWPGFSFGGVGGGDGDWGVWPFQGLDRVLISDRTTGLYVLNATGVSKQAAVLSVDYSTNPITGSMATTGSVYLVGISPVGGWPVSVTSASPAVAASSSIVVPAGAHNATFPQITTAVKTKTPVVMTGSDGIFQTSTTLTLLPAQLSSVTFNSNSVTGGTAVTGTVNLNIPAPANVPVTLSITAGAAAVASMPGSVTVPAGSSSANWTIQTNVVSTSTTVTIKAAANGASTSGSFVVR